MTKASPSRIRRKPVKDAVAAAAAPAHAPSAPVPTPPPQVPPEVESAAILEELQRVVNEGHNLRVQLSQVNIEKNKLAAMLGAANAELAELKAPSEPTAEEAG